MERFAELIMRFLESKMTEYPEVPTLSRKMSRLMDSSSAKISGFRFRVGWRAMSSYKNMSNRSYT